MNKAKVGRKYRTIPHSSIDLGTATIISIGEDGYIKYKYTSDDKTKVDKEYGAGKNGFFNMYLDNKNNNRIDELIESLKKIKDAL